MSNLPPPKKEPYCEHTLFNNESTYLTDYSERENVLKTAPPPLFYFVTPCRKVQPKVRKPFTDVKYIGTMLDWKKTIPFDALWKPKDIVRTNPHAPQKPYEKIEDLDREKVQLTRPRLVMTPAVSVDDMGSEERAVLIRDTYTSEMTARARKAVSPLHNVKAPLPNKLAVSHPLELPRLRKPLVSDEWRIEAAFWDRNQLRSAVDATKDFWLRPENAPKRCEKCKETAIVEAERRKRPF